MKIYGRAQNNEEELNNLVEASFVADPSALRDLASFLYRCADAIEEEGEAWENENFESNEVSCPDVVVFNPYVVEGSLSDE